MFFYSIFKLFSFEVCTLISWWTLCYCSVMSDSLWPHGLQHTKLLCPSPSPRACLNSGPLSRWCHPMIMFLVVPFSSCLQSSPVWGCRIVWCILTSRYQVSLLPVSINHVSDIFLVGFWSWEISFIMWGCRGWGWQAAGTWVSVSREMVGVPAPIGWPGASQSICTQ